MPSNSIRGFIVGGLTNLWNRNQIVRAISYLVLTLDFFYSYQTFSHLYFRRGPDGRPHGFQGAWNECERRFHTCRDQRNAYITGFSIFVFLIMQRLLVIQGQLFEARKEVKSKKSS